MPKPKYNIIVNYSFKQPNWGNVSRATFEMLINRSLEFNASPSLIETNDLNSVRVFINYKDMQQGYSPAISNDMERLSSKLTEIANALQE